jgi:KUP system potassium uptake protein
MKSVYGLLLLLLLPARASAAAASFSSLIMFFITDGTIAFLALGAVVLAVTGSEALYSDMGHFGRGPMRLSWFGFVMPCLLLNYFGQGAMIAGLPADQAAEVVRNPFFLLASEEWRLPLVILATMATFIASQAVISGAFSITHQAMQLGFIPRLSIRHTSETEAGQIYIPVVNWALMVAVIVLVLTFQNSSNLASAYGIAVTGAMFIDTLLLAAVLFSLWKWPLWKGLPLVVGFRSPWMVPWPSMGWVRTSSSQGSYTRRDRVAVWGATPVQPPTIGVK